MSAQEVALAEAMAAEQAIAEEAAVVRDGATELTAGIFLQLWPLLRRPIPMGFIESIGVVIGKPYESTGIKSVQAQHNRMNNVLTPFWWWEEIDYSQDGQLARVCIGVGMGGTPPLYTREAWGGVNRASTIGNLHKGSYTNAAKLAFARIGPGHEVYLGATDLDPDVHEESAEQQAQPATAATSSADAPRVLSLDERERVIAGITEAGENVQLMVAAVGAGSVEGLTTAHAFELRKLLDERGGVVA